MTSFSILFTFGLIGAGVGHASSFLKLYCSSPVKAQYGQASILECKIKFSDDVENPIIKWVSWKMDGGNGSLVHFESEQLTNRPGYSLAEESWATSMDLSLLISNTTVQHEGRYSCQVMTNAGSDRKQSSLMVTARYSVPTITKSNLSTGSSVLTCDASGGYPEGHIRWFDGDNNEMTERATMKIYKTDGGLFQMSSRLNLDKGPILSQYNCTVFNYAKEQEHTATFEFPPEMEGQGSDKKPDHIQILAPVLVVGSLIVGLLVVLVLWRCKQRRCNHPVKYEAPEGVAYTIDQKTADEEHHVT